MADNEELVDYEEEEVSELSLGNTMVSAIVFVFGNLWLAFPYVAPVRNPTITYNWDLSFLFQCIPLSSPQSCFNCTAGGRAGNSWKATSSGWQRSQEVSEINKTMTLWESSRRAGKATAAFTRYCESYNMFYLRRIRFYAFIAPFDIQTVCHHFAFPLIREPGGEYYYVDWRRKVSTRTRGDMWNECLLSIFSDGRFSSMHWWNGSGRFHMPSDSWLLIDQPEITTHFLHGGMKNGSHWSFILAKINIFCLFNLSQHRTVLD